jgi:LacI family transcriptional regulator
VKQPFQEMGKRAAETLLALVHVPQVFDGGWYDQVTQAIPAAAVADALKAVQIQLPTRLVVRESCGARLQHPSSQLQLVTE